MTIEYIEEIPELKILMGLVVMASGLGLPNDSVKPDIFRLVQDLSNEKKEKFIEYADLLIKIKHWGE